ncbi:MAG TPA: hypothetical protein VER96_33835 [Polyangiaceae bacterium]|nr:hypothetical protein [Polyangiaceae bacterium]
MTFKRVNDFATEDPAKLDRELSQLESNIDAEFNLVRKELAPQLRVDSFYATASRGIVAMQPDKQLTIDTSIAPATAVFPKLTPANFGRRFVIVKRAGANNITTSCQDATVLCNGAAFPVLAAVGRYEFTCDASGYYR